MKEIQIKTSVVVFTGVEKELLEERYKVVKLNDKSSWEVVETRISRDGKSLSVDQVKCWVDNFNA